jgi:hypothetical protein
MTGIVILPAGRDDAFEDYKQFIRDGHPIEDIESYLKHDIALPEEAIIVDVDE